MRYAGPTLLQLSASYLEHDRQSYRADAIAVHQLAPQRSMRLLDGFQGRAFRAGRGTSGR